MKNDTYEKQFMEMLKLQEKFNEKISKTWRTDKDTDFASAILVESGEFLESVCYKWWKKTDLDLDNAKVELIDIWHFLMSLHMKRYNCDYLTEEYSKCYYNGIDSSDLDLTEIRDLIKRFNCSVVEFDLKILADPSFACPSHTTELMFRLFSSFGLSLEDMFKSYIVKNVLNNFRANNGYKDGTYNKMWNGEEDNVVAYRIYDNIKNSYVSEGIFNIMIVLLDTEYKKINK